MSHFTVAVFTDGTKTVEELLEPYYEYLEVPIYIEETKEQAVKRVRKEIGDYATIGYYAEYLKNPQKYEADCKNPNHLDYIKNEFPKKLQWTDEECYQDVLCCYDEDMIDEHGNLLSTYNPNSKWDWWVIGGSWESMLTTKDGSQCDSAKVSDIVFPEDFSTFAVVFPNGEWQEHGKMGWWGCVSNEDEEWQSKYKEKFIDTANSNWTLTIIDCHI